MSQKQAYATVFDVLLGRKPLPKDKRGAVAADLANTGELGAAYAQMLMAPTIYGVEQGMADVAGELDVIASHKYKVASRKTRTYGRFAAAEAGEIKIAPSTIVSLIANPKLAIDKAFADAKAARKLARLGAWNATMEVALFSIWGSSLHMGKGLGVSIGRLWGPMRSAKKVKGKAVVPWQAADYSIAAAVYDHAELVRNATDSTLEAAAIRLEGTLGAGTISRAQLKKILHRGLVRSSRLGTKQERIDAMVRHLKSQGVSPDVLDPSLSTEDELQTYIAEMFWGNNSKDDDLGLWTLAHDKEADKEARALKAARERLELRLVTMENFARDQGRTAEADKLKRFRFGLQSYMAGGWSGSPKGIALFSRVGRLAGQLSFSHAWLKDQMGGGKLLRGIVTGQLFGDPIWGAGLVDAAGHMSAGVGPDGNPLTLNTYDKFMVGRYGSVGGRVSEYLYYYHPVNIIKGLVWDGRLLRKWAFKFDPDSKNYMLNGKFGRVLYTMHHLTPKQLLGRLSNVKWIKKIRDSLAGKIQGFLDVEGWLKKFITFIITKIAAAIGMAIPGVGWIAGAIATVLAPVVKPLFELLLIIILGILVGGAGFISTGGGRKAIQPVLSPPYTGELLYAGSGPGYEGAVPIYSGTADQIFKSVATDMGVSVGLTQLDCGGKDCKSGPCALICGVQGPGCDCPTGAWCYSASGTIYCRGEMLASASDEVLSRLFRHELTHQIQARYYTEWASPREGWGSGIRVNVTEWGAEHVSGNGGGYCFYTADGRYLSGMGVSQALRDKGCSTSLLNEAAYGRYDPLLQLEASCGWSPRTYITKRQIGGSCGR